MCEKIIKSLGKLKDLTLRKLPKTQYHKQAWNNYEKVLMYRANFLMAGKILIHWSYEMTGQINH